MGLIGWIKKEIDSTARQRRQSAPPPSSTFLASPNQHRDEAYMRAISKFHEWRNSNNQRFARLDETKNVSEFGQTTLSAIDKTSATDDLGMISDVEMNDNERHRLVQIKRDERKNKEAFRRLEHNAIIYNSVTPTRDNSASKNHRFSLPIMKGDSVEKKRKNRKKIQQSNTIDEIEEFEQNHCFKNGEDDYTFSVTSPPSRFYHDNSEPYFNYKLTPEQPKEPTPRRSLGKNILRRVKSSRKGKAPQPPVARKASVESESTDFANGNFKHYEVKSTSMYDEFVISSKNYRGMMRQENPEKVNSVGESASSTSLSSDPERIAKMQRRLSPSYQTVINKHGDEVEYALPFNERDSLLDIPPLPDTPAPVLEKLPPSKFEQIINDNFRFLATEFGLNSRIDEDGSIIKKRTDEVPFDPYHEGSFTDRRKDVQVTDLDKSNDTALTAARSGDIIKELDTLTKWTRNLLNYDKIPDAQSCIQRYQIIQNNVKIFQSRDIKYKSGILRNSFPTPLEFSTGYFHATPVTLRKTMANNYSTSKCADVASKREFEILSQIRHANIVILMGICYDDNLHEMSLVMEPFDFTLNHYIHQMDHTLTLPKIVYVAKQVASAVLYLHECGYVHSNISSHAILLRDDTLVAKLSCFELVTEILPRKSIGLIHHQTLKTSNSNIIMDSPVDLLIAERYLKLSKQNFYNRNSKFVTDDIYQDEYRLPYTIEYRRQFSMHYYQPPELMMPTYDMSAEHVLPTTRSDTFALSLMVWEALNRCVPFVIYNHDELADAYKKQNVQLPILNRECSKVLEIFEKCLLINAGERTSNVTDFVDMLNELDYDSSKSGHKKIKPKIIEQLYRQPVIEDEASINLLSPKMNEKISEKIYFTKPVAYDANADHHRRVENAITSADILEMTIRDTSKIISDSIKSSEMEPNVVSWSHQPGILHDDALDRIRKSVEDQKVIAPKKPTRRREQEEMETSKTSLTNSTMYQSFFDFNRLHTPKIDKDVIYERTSTLKKRLKVPTNEPKKSVKELFERQAVNDEFAKMNRELDNLAQNCNKIDFLSEVVKEHQRQQSVKFNDVSSKVPNNDRSCSFDELPITERNQETLKRSESDNCYSSSYSFAIGDYSLPNTPIARQNKIRRNAWLSDNRKPSGGKNSDEDRRRTRSCENKGKKDINNSPDLDIRKQNQKQFNVNIRIHHNDLDASLSNLKLTNMEQKNDSINIKLFSPANNKSPLIKVNNMELHNSSINQIDINKKYYPMMPEMLSDVIQKQRSDRSVVFDTTIRNDRGQQYDNDENVIIPVRTSVRDAVKIIESTYSANNKNSELTPGRTGAIRRTSRSGDDDEFFTPQQNLHKSVHEGTQTDTEFFFTPSADLPIKESVNKQEEHSIPIIVNKRLENVVSQAGINQTPKKITTKVTVNMKKITRRSSDLGHMKQFQEMSNSRHSLCNNTELIKRIQMHFKSKETPCDAAATAISASCSSLMAARGREANAVGQARKRQKYFCRNCGFTMIPAGILQQMQSTGRISIASNLAESLQSIRYDDRSQSMAVMTKRQIGELKSTEDLYIDDDFPQEISQSLAANMELLPSYDFCDIMDMEIFQTEEHEFEEGDTLTENDLQQIEWPQCFGACEGVGGCNANDDNTEQENMCNDEPKADDA